MLKETLKPELVTVDLSGTEKHSIIRALLDILCQTGKVRDPDLAYRELLQRETDMSTGMENGVAIPHNKTDTVTELIACVGVSRRKINFESLDRKPSRIFVMTLSPKDATGPHVRFLADIGRLLRDAKLRKQILKAKTDQQLYEILTQDQA